MLLDFNAAPRPPRLALPVAVGLGKTTAMQRGLAGLLRSGALRGKTVVVGVPRHDLAAEQRDAFAALGVDAALWKGRSAPDPRPGEPDRLMCLDPSAPFDAIEVERVVETTSCKVTRDGVTKICPLYHQCGYQAQKPPLRRAEVVITAHDTLFHMAPKELGAVGLLVLDEGFWAAGLRGTDGKALLTLDGLRPHLGTVLCWTARNKENWEATADLHAAREKLWKVLATAPSGPLSVAALRAAGLTPQICRDASGHEHRRLRNPGLYPGMDQAERRRRIAAVLPEEGEPWAPPGRTAAMWMLISEALENDHDVAGAVLCDVVTENGTVRSLRLAWRAGLRKSWGAGGPVLHLDATLRPELVTPFLPDITVAEPARATEPHVRVRQVLGAPTSARALAPDPGAPARDQSAALLRRREMAALIALRARTLRGRARSGKDLLVIGQKAAVDALRALGLPANAEAVHFNALSGLDRWREVAGMMVLGRTLPAPLTVEALAAALTNRPPLTSRGDVAWWYGRVERRIALADGGVHATTGEEHADPTAEALRWAICEGELVQAVGRGRGVNRTPDTPLEIDLLTDVVLPVAVHEVLAWEEVQPSRHDIMAAAGVELENAADMTRCFPELWPSHDAARQDGRSVRNCYYRDLHNSRSSHSSSIVSYRPAGPGQKDRQARFDLALIPDPRVWLEARLGALAHFEMLGSEPSPPAAADPVADARARLTALSARLDAAIHQRLATDRARLAALSARLDAAKPHPAAA
jgi:putative DNA primase/helicase